MAGETQRTYAVKELDAESKLQDEGTTLEQHSDKTTKESSEHFPSTGTDARAGGRGAKVEKLEKERDYTQQREAVIRPQQTGKIDFRSLQNRPKFATDRTWSSGKSSPQSPSGKSRSREKGKRSGKSERGNPQQLYRLSITNPRSNPTIGIAYPQQKVSPPKKLEASRGPVSGSYRFHVPSIPEREAELQQEELNYSRCFQEASSNITSPSYTSQALGSTSGTSTHQHPPLSQQQQQPAPMESNNGQPGSQLLLADFQLSGSNPWQSPERTFNGASYGVSSQKSTSLTEANKASAFVPVPFQYGYQFLEDSTSDPFPCEQNPQSQDFTDSSLGSVHVTHASFSFTSGDGQEVAQTNTQFSNEQQPEDRTSYPQPQQPSQYLQAPQGAASFMHCPRSLSEDSASSDSSGSSSQQSEQGKSALPESSEAFGQTDSRDVAITSGSKRNCHTKETAANQRTLIQGNVHHSRNIAQGPSSQMHFPNKTYHSSQVSNIHVGSVPFDKNINNKVHSRLPHSWEGSSKTYTPVDQNTIPYADMNEKFQFQNQPALDQRPNSSKNSRMPWQQLRLTSAMPSQNRIELSRQLSNQKLPYMVSPSDWQDDSKSHKNGSLKSPSSFQSSRTSEGFSSQRQESVKHSSSSTISSFKVEMSHPQVCESKNKPVYFGMNQSLPGAPSRNYTYPPLQVPPMGLMMVSPYESPLPSPVHNPTSSSTCSSLSPASNSPVNLSSEDSQMSKAGPPPPFYHQQQAKTLPSDHLSTNPHHFHSDVPRNLPYASDRAKDDMMSYLQNSVHPKTAMDGNKGYMDSFGVDHHQPPPPYSAHQLATSLATANLDQLDVLLTCKQCDQNFNNLASFLGHKQYCAQHAFAQNDIKDISKMEDSRKFHTEMSKVTSSGSSISMPRCPSELHLSLLGLNKNGELMCDSETKGDNKEDPMKLNLFSGPGNLPVPLPDLEMEDAKLDSLITEALNGLGYQSDNAEIDSSFIDAFADDDLTTVKAASNKQSLNTKESMVFESKIKQATDDDRTPTQGKYLYDSDLESPETDKQYTESKFEKISLNLEKDEKINIKKEVSHKKSRIAPGGKSREQDIKLKEARKLLKSEDENTSTPRFLLSSKFSERCGVKSFQDSSVLIGSTSSQGSATNQTSPTARTAVKESKRKRSGGGTWSKELIHKIVQQKNKLHKLHVKGTKNLQFSLVMERLTPTVQNPAFGEYDYVSDSDDECEPVKIASQGRLSQSSRCKYTYTKECKWRARSERDQAAWRHESKECFEVKKSEEVSLSPEKHGSHQRLRRRGSRSSTSSELSTSVSVSGDSINSPKSTDRTDSDCEKKMEIRRRESPEQKTYERSSPQKLCKESSSQLALTFTKSAKKYNTDKPVLSANKDKSEALKSYHSHVDEADPVSSSPKAKGAIKNIEKCQSSHTTSREKLESYSKEIGATVNSDINNSQRIDNTASSEESSQSSNAHLKRLQLDSNSAATNKETDFNNKNERNSNGKSTCKRRDHEGPQATQPKLSDGAAVEKHSDSVCLVKEAVALVPKSASLCSSLIDDVCLSPTETPGPLLQKDTSHLIPYPLDQEQGLMKSPLSFDTSSVFGDLTVAEFDNGLYSDMPLQKEGFNSIENTLDKKEAFVSSFSPFLEQRDWGLMVDVSPVLPDEISQYKDTSEKSNEKKSDFNHVPLSLPEKIMDYSTNINSCASEDELEIKRIVNELENQLQTTKLESPSLLAEDAPKQLQMSKFSPLRLGDESENEGAGLDMSCPVKSIEVPVTSMPPEHFTEPGLPWSSPFQFDLMGEHHSPHTPAHNEPGVLEHFTEKEDNAPNMKTTVTHAEHQQQHYDQKLEDTKVKKETPPETKEDILEQRRYAENLIKSLEVISDSIFKKESITSEQEELNVTSLKSQQYLEIECQATDAVEREDHCEKEAITEKENILSPSNINERKDDIEFILNESQSSLSSSTDPAADGNQPILLQQNEPTENNDRAETKVISLEKDITEDSNMIESAYCLNMEMDDSHVAEGSCANSNTEHKLNKLFKNNADIPEHPTIDGHEEEEAVKVIISQTGSRPSSPTLPDDSLEKGENAEEVVETGWLERSADIQSVPEDFHSSPAGQLKVETSDSLREEGEIPAAEMEYSLISPPHLGIIDCKVQSTDATIPSPLPLTSTAEPPDASEGFPKRDHLYDFKLLSNSPLNYSGISNEPPRLNQYDYIPISPANNGEEKSDIKKSPRDDCEPCDLSVDPGLVTAIDTEIALNSDPPAKLSLLDEPLGSSSKESLEFTRIALGFPSQINCADSSTGNLKKDLDVCHNPPESLGYFHIHADLLRKVESENLDIHKAPLVQDATLLRGEISEGLPTPKQLIICEKKQMPLPPDPTGKQSTTETGQRSTTNQVQEELSPKKTSAQSSSPQGKAFCEICSMCFRTVPGLKRHKAMKHLVRTDKHAVLENTISNHQGSTLTHESQQTTEKGHKDESQTCFQTKLDGMPETIYPETSSNILTTKAAETELVQEDVAAETNKPAAVDDPGHHIPPLQTKAKKNNKTRKNKNSELNVKPNPFSDELLNILKTDILQAITPEFQNRGLQEHCKDQVKMNKHLIGNVTETEVFPLLPVASKSDVEARSPKEADVPAETAVSNQNSTELDELKCASMTEIAGREEELCADNSRDRGASVDKDISRERDESSKNLYAVEEMCEQKASEERLAKEILRKVSVEIKCENNSGPVVEVDALACLNSAPLSPGMSPDLKALLDDDTTFSQLFPRDEEVKRKKCPRVYGKRNKRQKLSPNSHLAQDYPPAKMFIQSKDQYTENQADETFIGNQSNHCEYETISIDDAIMLNMCHNSTLKGDAKTLSDIKQGSNDHVDVHENTEELGSNLLSPLESTIDKSSIAWSDSSDLNSFTADPMVSSEPSSCKAEVPTTPHPLPLPSTPYPVESCVTDNVSNFHSIDIQNINTTFQLPEIQFFDSSKDISVVAVDMENKDVEKSKKPTERRGRKRQDGSIKVKDKQYKCKVCFTWFLTLGELNFHKLSHNPSPPPTCYMCVQRKFSSREQLRDHLREKHAKNKAGIWTCGMCLKEISDVWMYNEHLREHATQFARKGQTQGSMLGIPGCFMQETAVKNFITSIMQHRPSKTNRESSKPTKDQEKPAATESTVGEGKTTEGPEPKTHKTKSSNGTGGKQSTLTPLEVLHKTEAPKNVEMHPNCKDPSRDCHHCGKQFPKPFKLQRHLVVHNLEKIFLCHKCPVSYQEAQELKDHLKRAHEEVDELESKHTTLYTCELCADVMHVIKKSFICSTCNYTFSKKEQFDRHMEKHLSGGNKIFKFRGVLRPVKASASKDDECDFPASKKRKIINGSLPENSSDSGIASIGSLHLNQNTESQSSKPNVSTADDSTQTSANEYRSDAHSTNVKTEDIAEDYSDLLVELEQCAFHNGSSESATPKKEEIDLSLSPKLPDREGYVKSISERDVKEEDESVCIRAQTASQWSAFKENSNMGEERVKAKQVTVECSTDAAEEKRSEKRDVVPSSEDAFVGFRENEIISKTPDSEKQELAASISDQQREDEQGQSTTKTYSNDIKQDVLSNGAEQQGSSHMKDKISPAKTSDNTKNSSTSSPRATEPTQISKVSFHGSLINEDRESLRQQKKRKEIKSPHSLPRVSSPATRENLGVDPRGKKKFRPSKCESPTSQRKSDGPSDYPVLSSVRDDVVSNKIVSKCKNANLSMQSKRSLLDNCTPKKAEFVTQINGDYKVKKGPLGRPLHSPVSKVSAPPMNNSMNKSRPKMGVRSMESHSYRTAESQNHLLSQLFGQKLTSFKIPLRKDTSESIN
ncbi:zinc finger protein 469 [Polymixia lowei]